MLILNFLSLYNFKFPRLTHQYAGHCFGYSRSVQLLTCSYKHWQRIFACFVLFSNIICSYPTLIMDPVNQRRTSHIAYYWLQIRLRSWKYWTLLKQWKAYACTAYDFKKISLAFHLMLLFSYYLTYTDLHNILNV